MSTASPAARNDVAIVGMACVFPGAGDLKTYWENIVSKVDAIGDPPEDWDEALYYEPDSVSNDRTYCKRGGYLGDLATFDPVRHGVVPNSIDGGEPDHFLALRVAFDALEDAGYRDRLPDGRRVEVVLGRGTYVNRGYTTLVQHGMVVDQTLRIVRELQPGLSEAQLAELRQELKNSLPPFNAEVAPGLVPNIVSGRIANRLDLMGPNYLVDAACASSLVAVDQGMQDLLSGRCDMAVVGGVHASTPALIHMIFSQLGALSRRGEIRPFDKDADGTLLGEGVGIVVLKRTEDAEADGDRVYAVIKGVGVASDGRALGLLAPRIEGEELALRLAYERSAVEPRSIGLIEAHGTGTVVGDQTEIDALARVFGPGDGMPPSIALGTVKSMISHLLPASGAAGLIKVALALYHKVLPATLHCEEPNPKLGLATTPFYVNTETRPWVHGGPTPRRSGVNAFGFGGINAHAIVEEHTGGSDTDTLHWHWDTELCVVDAPSQAALVANGERLLAWLRQGQDVELKDLAHTLNESLSGPGRCLAIVASSAEDLRDKLAHALDRVRDGARDRIRDRSGIYYFCRGLAAEGKVAVMFPGEGAQSPNMLSELCIHFHEVREWFDLMDAAFVAHERRPLPSQVIYPPPGAVSQAAVTRLDRMDHAAEAVFAANQALWSLLRAFDLEPDGVVGHSTGEYSALLASGALRTGDRGGLVGHILDLHEVYRRLDAGGSIPKSTLLAVGGVTRCAVEAVVAQAGGDLHLAMDNCRHQRVVCGTAAAVAAAAEQLKARGAICTPVPFDRPYHTPMFAQVRDELRGFFDGLDLTAPGCELFSCSAAAPYPRDAGDLRRLALEQWVRPVRFEETVEAMYAAGYRVFVEAGPKVVLSAFADDILGDRPHLTVAPAGGRDSGITALNRALGELVAHGVPLDLRRLWARRGPERLDFTVTQSAKGNRNGRGVRLAMGLQPLRLSPTRSRPPLPPQPSQVPAPSPARPHVATGPNGSAADRTVTPPAAVASTVMGAYLQTMETFLNVEGDVVLSLLQASKHVGMPPAPGGLDPGPSGTEGRSVQRSAAAPAPAPPLPTSLPFVREVVSFHPGAHADVRLTLSIDEDLFLRDHTLGGTVSADDPALTALPVMPLTMSLEVLAQVASFVVPSLRVAGMRDVTARRWIAFDSGRRPLRVVAQREPSVDEVGIRVEIHADGPSLGPSSPIVEATVLLAERMPEPPAAPPLTLANERPSRWRAGDLYRHGMFHGPSFRGVVAVHRWGADGTEATLQALPADRLFASHPAPMFLTDPVLLDAAGQLVGYWIAEHLETGFNVFPVRVRSLWLYGEPLNPGEQAAGRARIALSGDQQVLADIDVVRPDGLLRARLEGWEDRRFELPKRLYELRMAPRDRYVASRWSDPEEAFSPSGSLVCCRIDTVPVTLLEGHNRIWRSVFAQLVLARDERTAWERRLEESGNGGSEWLLARAAAKDAVRLHIGRRTPLAPFPADIIVAEEVGGRLSVAGGWTRHAPPPLVAAAAAGSVAVAVAGEPDRWHGLGVDVDEASGRPDPSPGDVHDLLSVAGLDAGDLWAARLRGAERAARRSLAAHRPEALAVHSFDPTSGLVTLLADAPSRGGLGGDGGIVVTAWTGVLNRSIVAVAAW